MSNARYRKILNGSGGFGSGTVLEALGKIAPAINPFIRGAFVAGYAADQIADFLKNQFSTPEERRNQADLQERSSARVARPDEKAELSQIEQGQAPLAAVSQFGKLGSQAAGYLGSLKAQEQAEGQQLQQQEEESNRQQQELKLKEEESAFKRERQLERDLEQRKYRESGEKRAAEKHTMAMEKSRQPKLAQAPKAPSLTKAAKDAGSAKAPETYLDAVREFNEEVDKLIHVLK